MRLLACLIVAPQRGYDEPAILSYAISSFCPTSADGLQSWRLSRGWLIGLHDSESRRRRNHDHPNRESQIARKPACTLAKSITCSGQIIAIDQSLPLSSRTTS